MLDQTEKKEQGTHFVSRMTSIASGRQSSQDWRPQPPLARQVAEGSVLVPNLYTQVELEIQDHKPTHFGQSLLPCQQLIEAELASNPFRTMGPLVAHVTGFEL